MRKYEISGTIVPELTLKTELIENLTSAFENFSVRSGFSLKDLASKAAFGAEF